MGKLGNKFPQTQYTTTDHIKYLEELPDCIPNTCQNPFDNNLTNVLKLLLEKYCEKEINLEEADVACLIAANPSIVLPEDYQPIDLINYLIEHICDIYTKLCDTCCEECGGEVDTDCTIEKTIPDTRNRKLVIIFPEEIEFFSSGESLVNLIITLPGASNGGSKNFTIIGPESVENIIDQIKDEWENPDFNLTSSGNTLYLNYPNQFQSPTFTFVFTYSNPDIMLTTGNLNNIDCFAQFGGITISNNFKNLQNGTFIWNALTEEETAPICEILQDHEDRINIIENELATPEEPYVPGPIAIPFYRTIDIYQNTTPQGNNYYNISTHLKNGDNTWWIATVAAPTVPLESLVVSATTFDSGNINLYVKSSNKQINIKTPTVLSTPGYYSVNLLYTNGILSDTLNISFTVINTDPCNNCEVEPPPCEEYDVCIDFSDNSWNIVGSMTDTQVFNALDALTSGYFSSIGAINGGFDGSDIIIILPTDYTDVEYYIGGCEGELNETPPISIEINDNELRIPKSNVGICDEGPCPFGIKLLNVCPPEI